MKNNAHLFTRIVFTVSIILQISCSKKSETPTPIEPEIKQENIAFIDDKVNAWMIKNEMPGVSFAVSKNGKLVYSKGYGYTNTSSSTAVTQNSSFRIASVSKLITAVAVLKLVEMGKIQMDQKVFGANGILGTTYGTKTYDAKILAITLSDLLHHTSGGWSSANNDPSFMDPSKTTTEMLNWTIDYQPLTAMPNTRFDYSNIGFDFLEQVVSKVSGMEYSKFVEKEIWDKVGAKNSFIAESSLAGRKSNEAIYYGQGADIPYVYNMNLKRSLGAYGWASTAEDLLRFATAVDSSSTRPDILSLASIKTMTTPTKASTGFGWHFGCGWVVEGPEWFWWGSLAGTFSILYRNANGICIAATANSRYVNQQQPLNGMIGIINELATNKEILWQDIDQFK